MSVFVYWIIFLFPVCFVFLGKLRLFPGVEFLKFLVYILLVVIVVGFRYEVGADWGTYLAYYELMQYSDFLSALSMNDSGYMAINWISFRLGAGIFGVNIVMALMAVTGVVMIARRQPYPWLALVSSVPYFLVVVCMGYTRQSAAIGLLCVAMMAISQGNGVLALFFICCAALFHKTAGIFLPLTLLAYPKVGFIRSLLVVVIALSVLYFLFSDVLQGMWQAYVEQKMESSGGLVRAWMIALPGVFMLLFHRKILDQWPGARLWFFLSVVSIFALWFVNDYSTFVDRFLLYVFPITLVFYGRLPVLWRDSAVRTTVALTIVLLHGAVMWVWLNYAVYAESWVPYRMYPWIN